MYILALYLKEIKLVSVLPLYFHCTCNNAVSNTVYFNIVIPITAVIYYLIKMLLKAV